MCGAGLALACTSRPRGEEAAEDGRRAPALLTEQEKAQPRPVGLGGRQGCSGKRHHGSGQENCSLSQVSNGAKTASRSASEGQITEWVSTLRHPRERDTGKSKDAPQKQNKLLHVTETFSGCVCACTSTHTRTRQLTVSKATSKISLKTAQLLLYPDFVFKDLAKPKEWPEKKKKKKTHFNPSLSNSFISAMH